MYLVDTNVLSEARRKSPEALGWLRSAGQENIWLSVITLGEISLGIERRRRKNPDFATQLAEWLTRIRRAHANRILPVNDEIALAWGRIATIRSRGEADGVIAATALIHGLAVVTRNTADFADAGVRVVNPWAP